MLQVSYDADRQVAELRTDDPSATWEKIQRVVLERSEGSSLEGPQRLVLPWWEFLSCREAIAHHVKRAGLRIEIDDAAKVQLRRALARQDAYQSAASTEPLSVGDIKSRLDEHHFGRDLTGEQLRNVRRLAATPAAATFSVPGAGKTTEALATWSLWGGHHKQLLVVAPKNAFAAWEEQLEICLPDLHREFVRLTGGYDRIRGVLRDDPPTLALITYHQLITVADLVSEHVARRPSIVFLDESHRMKRGTSGAIGNAVLALSHLPDAKLIMTGTPMPNSAADLVPQFNFLYPEIRASPDDVIRLIQPIYVRTTKDELGLPKPKTKIIDLSLSPAERSLYDALRSEEARSLLGIKARDRIMLRSAGKSALRLLQAASNPSLLPFGAGLPEELLSEAIAAGGGTKLDYVCRRARELANQRRKVVIWSSFIKNVEVISERLRDVGADYVHGGVATGDEEDDETREAKIKAFHDDDARMVLVANPAACSEGISLHTVCHDAIYLDRTYNAAQYMQSRDRIHRLGLPQGAVTRIEIVTAKGTIDQLVHQRLKDKVQRMAHALRDSGLHAEEADAGDPDDPEDVNFTLEDLRGLMDHLREE